MSRILVTGSAGFIGMHVVRRLLNRGDEVIGVDNMNAYYDPALKHHRLDLIREHAFRELDLADRSALDALCASDSFDSIIHLAAQAGVRHSIDNPSAYVESNLVGFVNMLEVARNRGVQHFVYASSSSVYGQNAKVPFAVGDPVDRPVSLYAATKRSNELMAYTYSHLFAIPTTGLRFFTVYGPWGRPDMAYYKFTKAILSGTPIDVYNNGALRRDFTYIDDIVEGVVRVLDAPPVREMHPRNAIYNIGNHHPVGLLQFIETLEKVLGRKAEKRFLGMQAGDVQETFADISTLEKRIDFRPTVPLEVGLERFANWYRSYHR